jgi:hypothetical protein
MKDQVWFGRCLRPRQEKAKMIYKVWFGSGNKDGGYIVISGAKRNRLIIIVGSA